MVINKKVLIIWSIIIILFILVILIGVIYLNNLNGRKITDIEDILSYSLEYDMTVVSNKNINTYFVKEWYKESVGNKFEYLDYMKNTVSITLNKDDCLIKNSKNKAYILTNNIYESENVSSLSFFLNSYKYKCNCKKYGVNKNEENRYVIEISNKDSCNLKDVLESIKIDKLELVLKDNIPITYTVYSGGREYISIVYRKQDLNCNIDESVFSIT